MPKLLQNAKRDKVKIAQLEEMGWSVLVVWQCELKSKNIELLLTKVVSFLEKEDP